MLKDRAPTQSSLEFVCIDELVPEDHLLRKIESKIDFSFIHELVKDLYCDNNGRPALDPTLMFKLLFIGYLYGVRSERQLIREAQVNVAYRWFLGLGLTDKLPDASTLSQNRRRRFNESDVYQQIFDEIVLQAMKRKLVSGKTLYTDSTHLKANANRNKWVRANAEESSRDYLAELEQAVQEDRLAHGKKPLAPPSKKPVEREIKQSTTDSEAGYMDPNNIQIMNDLAWFCFVGLYSPLFLQNLSLAICILKYKGSVVIYPRWMAYMTVWAAILYVPGALLPFFPDGPFSWEGIISFWMVAVVLFVWIAVAWWLTVRSIKSAPAS